MRKLIILIVCLFPAVCFAQYEQPIQKYNPFENRWETTYPSGQLQYNPFENRWQHVTPPSGQHPSTIYPAPQMGPTYNPFTNRWEFPK